MKRRLSIAIALLSNPAILFLDEPTTGLDPEMKRLIWSIIHSLKHDASSQDQKCIILTTHAMDEAEALCDRIGIMTQGVFKCIGNQTALRNRYGATFELTFTVSNTTAAATADDSLQVYLSQTCTSVHCVSAYGQTRVYTIDKSNVEMGSLFAMLCAGQESGLYTEWGISNTSLDEVFCAITAESEGVNASEL